MAQFNVQKNSMDGNNKTLFETVMVAGGVSAYIPKGNLNTTVDAFGRARVSTPHTLFDSSFRYRDSQDRWNTKLTGSGTVNLDVDASIMEMAVGTASGDQVIRETDRVFGYQPGKSLLTLNTFTMAPAKTNLRQRVGYFGKDNGFYVQLNDDTLSLVKRSSSSGSLVETVVNQADWNIDPLDGSGPSGVNINIAKSQIFWSDIEWLGVGSVRLGFVFNGQFVPCHVFHHANSIEGTYMTTASLPVRYEVTNTGETDSASTLKQICSSVVSEGGYNLTGLTQSIATPIIGKNLVTGINPIISLRLRSGKTDAIVEPREISLYGVQATAFNYKVIRGGTLTNASWDFGDSDFNVEYDLSATAITGGTTILDGIFKGQSTVPVINLKTVFDTAIQLTRGIIEADSAGDILTVAVQPTTNNDDVIASLTWQNHTA